MYRLWTFLWPIFSKEEKVPQSVHPFYFQKITPASKHCFTVHQKTFQMKVDWVIV